MTADTATLTTDTLETIQSTLMPVWTDLLGRGETSAAEWVSDRIIECQEEVTERDDQLYAELAGLGADSGAEPLIGDDEIDAMTEARSGHITLLSHDEVAAAQKAAGPWVVWCETCEQLAVAEGRDQYAACLLGYYRTEAEANAARARHVAEAGDR